MTKKMWGGRFKKKIDPLVEEFTSSISYDERLALYDIKGSIAHAKMLGKCNIITKKESARLVKGLRSLEKKINKIKIDQRSEDIHYFGGKGTAIPAWMLILYTPVSF